MIADSTRQRHVHAASIGSVAAQLIERIGCALADAEDVESRQPARPEPPDVRHDGSR